MPINYSFTGHLAKLAEKNKVRKHVYVCKQRRNGKHKKDTIVVHTFISDVNNEFYYNKYRLRISGDVEENPGPLALYRSSSQTLCERLARVGLREHPVPGDGNCFFYAVSHQLWGTIEHYATVRACGISYLCAYPEMFIESHTENYWTNYIETSRSDAPSKSCDPTQIDCLLFWRKTKVIPIRQYNIYGRPFSGDAALISSSIHLTRTAGNFDRLLDSNAELTVTQLPKITVLCFALTCYS